MTQIIKSFKTNPLLTNVTTLFEMKLVVLLCTGVQYTESLAECVKSSPF